jgi:predicted nucleotidyltransferase
VVALTLARETDAESLIVRAAREAVDADGVILCGSRAIGDAVQSSDWDVCVVLPTRRIPRALGPLREAGSALEDALAAPVSLNPLPRFRLRRPGRSYLVWKIGAEGRVLDDRRLPVLRPTPPSDVAHARVSYATSGLRYLISRLVPSDLAGSELSDAVARDVRKALLHAAQLRLLVRGGYASSLETCLTLLPADEGRELADLAGRSASPASWLGARDLLVPLATRRRPGFARAFVDDAQFLALTRLAGKRASAREVVRSGSVAYRASMAVVDLANAVDDRGWVDAERLASALAWTSPFVSGKQPSWPGLRDALEDAWGRIEPLVGL